MELPLQLRARKSGELVYGIPLWYRIASLLALAVFATAVVASGGTGPVGVLVVLACAFAALYEERWSLDGAKGAVESRTGLLFMARRERHAFAEVAGFRVELFAKGKLDQASLPDRPEKMPTGSQARLLMELSGGERRVIDSVSWRKRERLEAVARAMSALVAPGA